MIQSIATILCIFLLIFVEYEPAILRDYQLLFNMKYGNEASAGVIPNPNHDTHGILFCMDSKSLEKLNNWERIYQQVYTSVETYDGQIVDNVLVYVSPKVCLTTITHQYIFLSFMTSILE